MKVLIGYASRAGSTREIAEFIGERLLARGIQPDAEGVDNVRSVAGYDALVI